MMTMPGSRPTFLVLLASTALSSGNALNLADGAKAGASSERPEYSAPLATDGTVSDASRWLAVAGDASPSLEITFPSAVTVGAVDVYSGYQNEPGLADFDLSFEQDGRWSKPAEGRIRGNADNARRVLIALDRVTRMRLALAQPGAGRIREIAVYQSAGTPPGTGLKGKLPPPKVAMDTHQIALNQIGFEPDRPKRFTAPLSADGTQFIVREASGNTPLFRGGIRGHIGDFSEFKPASSDSPYVIEVRGGSIRNGAGDPFLIRKNLWQDSFWQPAVDFLIDSRSVIGTHPSAYGGCPWRDGTYYDAILPALVMFYLADPARVEKMPRRIDWAADKARVLDPSFAFDAGNPNSHGVLEATRRYFNEFEPPAAGAPDVVKLLHWGAGFYLVNPATADPSGDPDGRKIHSQTVEQVAYIVWAWPKLQKWLPASFYRKCLDFCFANWEPSLGIDKWWDAGTYLTVAQVTGDNPTGGLLHPYKGRHAPGHSIVPNLLMHEISKREKRDDADRYLDAAVKQAAWIVRNLDWNDPRTTKGQRMSEHRTIPNLVWLLQKYPDKAPPGLADKIGEWAQTAISRSNNLWDFRRYDDGEHWTIPKLNDIGNSASFPGVALSASWVARDPAVRRRLEELAVSQIDYLFGRNPRLAAAPHLPGPDFPGVERGWPRGFQDNVCARLELCRGSLSSGPGSEMFPFKPDGPYRHPEGWVNYGAAWCLSLAYLRFDAAKTTPAP